MRDISQLNATLPRPTATFVPSGSQLTVTIGRNVGSTPMSDTEWDYFIRTVQGIIVDHFAPSLTFGPFYGTGEWQGVTEESAVITAVTHYPGSTEQFGTRLADIARTFGQDAIAWSFGPSMLAER